jgi:UPF0755 protein
MRRAIYILGLLIIVIGIVAGVILFKRILATNVRIDDNSAHLYIPTGYDFEDVMSLLVEEGFLRDSASFRWVALKKNYPRHIYPGRYLIPQDLNNNQLVSLLRSGKQDPVKLVFNNMRTPEKLAGVISSQIEADSLDILALFSDRDLMKKHDLSDEIIMGVFIPNTYEIYWNTSAEEFLERMLREYRVFWNEKRLSQARKIGLEPMEVITLASIVDEETLMKEEEARVAGVYINRLKRRIRLQADPTVKYAVGDMSITRVLKKHLETDSPYNTYRHGGLPPGPIIIPSVSAIEAVLNYEQHNYLYFCAKEDFSGYHNFASSITQHNRNARLYQKALDDRRIMN